MIDSSCFAFYSTCSLEQVAGSMFLYLKLFGEADRLSQQIKNILREQP
jgi:hypothetical protein